MIENEFKYVLKFDPSIEALFKEWSKTILQQGYLPGGARIRRTNFSNFCQFTYKLMVTEDGERKLVEIEKDIESRFFNLLWAETNQRLLKMRYSLSLCFGEIEEHWDVDFFLDENNEVYFIMAEVELPENQIEPQKYPDIIAKNIVYRVTQDDNRFTSKNLSDPEYARNLMLDIPEKF